MAEYTRVRSTDSRADGVVTRYSNAPSGNYPSYTVFCILENALGSSKSISDNPTPNFRKRMAAGDIIMNELMISEQTTNCSDATITVGPYDDWGVSSLSGPLAAMVGALAGREGFDEQGRIAAEIATNKAFASMNSSPLLTGEFASDFGQTIGLLRKPIASAVKLVTSTRERAKWYARAVKSYTFPRACAKAWLEKRYGFQPLIGDCEAIIDQSIDLRRSNQRRRLVARGGEAWTHQESADFFSTGYYTWPNLSAYGKVSGSGKGLAQAGVIYELVEPSHVVDRWSAALGLRLRDMPATAWEIMPFSFVLDWSVKIGDWIQASIPAPGVTVLGSWCTRVATWTSSSSPELYNAGFMNHPPTIASGGTLSRSERYVIRNVGVGPSTLPPIKRKPLGIVQTVDALSLLVGSLTSGLRELRH